MNLSDLLDAELYDDNHKMFNRVALENARSFSHNPNY